MWHGRTWSYCLLIPLQSYYSIIIYVITTGTKAVGWRCGDACALAHTLGFRPLMIEWAAARDLYCRRQRLMRHCGKRHVCPLSLLNAPLLFSHFSIFRSKLAASRGSEVSITKWCVEEFQQSRDGMGDNFLHPYPNHNLVQFPNSLH